MTQQGKQQGQQGGQQGQQSKEWSSDLTAIADRFKKRQIEGVLMDVQTAEQMPFQDWQKLRQAGGEIVAIYPRQSQTDQDRLVKMCQALSQEFSREGHGHKIDPTDLMQHLQACDLTLIPSMQGETKTTYYEHVGAGEKAGAGAGAGAGGGKKAARAGR